MIDSICLDKRISVKRFGLTSNFHLTAARLQANIKIHAV